MAIAHPTLFTTISGKMGAVEFAQRGNTVMIRNAKKPRTKVTWRTIEAQRIHAQKITDWKYYQTTYPPFYAEWAQFAATHPIKNRLGQSRTLSGFQYYMKYYAPLFKTYPAYNWPPNLYPGTPAPINFWATLVAPSTFIVNADFLSGTTGNVIKIISYSDPITATTNYKRLRYHHLTNTEQQYYQSHSNNYTALCTQRQLTWTAGQQFIVAIEGAYPRRARSPKRTYTVTVTAP